MSPTVWLVLCWFFCPQSVQPLEVSTLRLVHILFRHGARTADKVYPSGAHNEDFWPQGLAQLTTVGMKQEYDLGTYIRSRYDNFVNSSYVRSQIYIESTSKDRCLMSAYCVLAGMYPPQGDQVWSAEIPWQPIPVHTNDHEPMLGMDTACKKYDKEFADAVDGPEGKILLEENEDFIKNVTALAGYKEVSLNNMWDVFDPLLVETEWGIQPDWLTPEMMSHLTYIRQQKYEFWHNTPEMTYFRAGLFMQEISNNTKTRIENTMDKRMKLFLYSAHDSTIVAMLKALQVYNYKTPPYGTALIFELHQKPDGSHVVKVLLKNDTTTNLDGDPHELQLPGCTVECPSEKFLQLIQPMVMEGDWDEECGNNSRWVGTGGFTAVVASIAVVVLILFGIIVWCGCKKHSHTRNGYQPIPS